MSSKIYEVLRQAVLLVEPSNRETSRVQRTADTVLKMVRNEAGNYSMRLDVVLGGSFAKGTWLKGEADIDIFVKFPENSAEDVLEKIGINLALKSLMKHNPTLRYSEHPYVEAFFHGIRINLVPCYDVPKGRWRSAADRSPYHTAFIVQTFDDSLRREARLLKKFLKGLGIYGAEIKIQGFSGYVSEVLVWKYGSLKSVLEAATIFKDREVISTDGAGEDIREIFRSPLIILDPIDENRNLGTAISAENVGKFILASRRFLNYPTISLFKKPASFDSFSSLQQSKLLNELVVVIFAHEKRSPDILWGQLRRSISHLQKQLESKDFKVLRSRCASDDTATSAFIFLMESRLISNYVIRLGPKVHMTNDLNRFLAKNYSKSKTLWIGSDSRVLAQQGRRFTKVESVFEDIFSNRVRDSGLAPGLKLDVTNSYRIYSGKEVLKAAAKYRWLAEAMLYIVNKDKFIFGAG